MNHDDRCNRKDYRLVPITGIVAAIGFAVAISPALAQNVRQVDLSVGYLHVNRSMHGANVQVSAPMTRRWSVVGEFAGAFGPDCAGCDPNYRDLAGLGGVRFAWHPTPRYSPFWQVLAGGLHSTALPYYVDYCCGLGPRYQEKFTVNYFALQPGGGITAMVTPRFGIRAQADLQFAIPDQSQWEGMSIFGRVVAGAVIPLGKAR